MGLFRRLYFHSLLILAIGLGTGRGLAAPDDSQTQNSPTVNQSQSQDYGSDVHIPPQEDCLDKIGDWSEPEKWAWQQICARENVDFDKRYGKLKDLDDLAGDKRRELSAQFLRQILEEPRFQPYTQNAAVAIVGAFLQTVQVSNASIGFFSITNCKIGGDIDFDNVTILRSILVVGSKVGKVVLNQVEGGNINFNTSAMGEVSAQQLRLTRLSFNDAQFTSLTVRISRFSDQLSIFNGTSQKKILLDEVKSDGLFVEPASAKSIDINDYVDTGMFFLSVGRWLPESELQLHTLTTGRFFLRKSLPAKISTAGFVFSGADWGDDPLPQLRQWVAASSEYTPGLYTGLANSYLDGGQSGAASDILIAKQNADYAHSGSLFEKTYLFVTWLLADYGFHPEVGLLWILGFVGVATVVFKTGEETLPSESRPRNWLVFALDSVIPGIQLDSQHKEISFVGWRQYFLYFLRFLSAVVVVLVIELLKKSLSGLG
jgi:hypothetical protein